MHRAGIAEGINSPHKITYNLSALVAYSIYLSQMVGGVHGVKDGNKNLRVNKRGYALERLISMEGKVSDCVSKGRRSRRHGFCGPRLLREPRWFV